MDYSVFALVIYILFVDAILNIFGVIDTYGSLSDAYWGVAVTGSGAVFITIWLYRAVITLLIVKGNYSYVLTNKRVIRPSDFILHERNPGYFFHKASKVVYVEKTPKVGYLLIYDNGKEKLRKVAIGYLSRYRDDFLSNLKKILGGRFEVKLL